MKKILVGALLLTFCAAPALRAELFTNPAANVGKKNLFVGAEYSSILGEYRLDTNDDLPVVSQRVLLKATIGLTDRIDVYVKGGGVDLRLDYKSIDDTVVRNFDPPRMKPGFGAGTRVQLFNDVDSGTRVFLQGGGFFFSTSGSAEWNTTGRMVVKDRSMRWLDLNVGVGVARRIDFVDLNAGLGLSEIKWWIRDTRRERVGTEVITTHSDWRDSFETRNPVMGFLGIDFILPHQYRLSAQAGVRSMNAAEITVSVSQGLEKE